MTNLSFTHRGLRRRIVLAACAVAGGVWLGLWPLPAPADPGRPPGPDLTMPLPPDGPHHPPHRARRGGPALPARLTAEQRAAARAILEEAAPRLQELRGRLSDIMADLHDLAYTADTPQDRLTSLGRQLVAARDALRQELQRVNERMAREAGFNPGWGRLRGCNLWEAPSQAGDAP